MPRVDVSPEFRRSAAGITDRTAESGQCLIRAVCDALGLADLSTSDVLDVGCGTKFTEALINNDLPIQRYVGVDVYRDMIEFLAREVSDRRFSYVHLDVRNELYNPSGRPMTPDTDLGVGAQTFDIIWLFSVFTHLNPDDFRVMMQLLRGYVREDGALFFTVFLNERSPTGYGFTEQISQSVEEAVASGRDVAPAVLAALAGDRDAETPRFQDIFPTQPLMVAMYTRDYALELIDGTGWVVEAILPPSEFAQHQVVCRPVR
jgi:SAM-dependent methyltransferase